MSWETKRKPDVEYMTVREAGKLLVCSNREIKRMCASGRFRGVVLENNRFIIPADSVHFVAWEE